MKLPKYLIVCVSLISLAVTFGCGGSGGGSDSGSSSTGTVSMSITDAKPVLPENVTNCVITIDEVLVHSPGGGWKSLPMEQTPYTIDLLQFTDGITTEFVPPVEIQTGKYTQVRLSVTEAVLRFDNGGTTEDVTMTIPSENLKTDKNFDFEVIGSGPSAVDITIDFDLSKSIVVEGPAGNESYKLKPVLHIVETEAAAAISGTITDAFVDGYVVITVKDESKNEEYTRVRVEQSDPTYLIYWLVPGQTYVVQIDYLPETSSGTSVEERTVTGGELGPGAIKTDVDFPVTQ